MGKVTAATSGKFFCLFLFLFFCYCFFTTGRVNSYMSVDLLFVLQIVIQDQINQIENKI